MNIDMPAAAAAYKLLMENALLRADMYQLLAMGFLDPTRDLAAGLADGTFQNDVLATANNLVVAYHVDGEVAETILGPTKELLAEEFAEDAEEVYHELAVEYTRLFIGPSQPVVSPYESVHVDSDEDSPALLMVGPSARAVIKVYREAGLDMAEGVNEPPDHIATEIEFMYYLCRQEAGAWQASDSAEARTWRQRQRTFAAEHLGAWGIEFCGLVQEHAEVRYYALLGELASGFFQIESEATA